MRKSINYSKCYSRRSREEEVRKEKKDTLKKIGYFVAGAATAIGVRYVCLNAIVAKDLGERLISHAEPLITKF